MKRKLGNGLKAIIGAAKLTAMLFVPGGFYPYILYENHKEVGRNDSRDHIFFGACEVARDVAYYLAYSALQ
jgi:hypothetical protein